MGACVSTQGEEGVPAIKSMLLPWLQSLREIQLHDLTTHLDIFEDHRENDYEEMQHRFQDLQMEFKYPLIQLIALSLSLSHLPFLHYRENHFFFNSFLTDPVEVFRMVNGMVIGTNAENYFLSILQHMMLIRDDYWAR